MSKLWVLVRTDKDNIGIRYQLPLVYWPTTPLDSKKTWTFAIRGNAIDLREHNEYILAGQRPHICGSGAVTSLRTTRLCSATLGRGHTARQYAQGRQCSKQHEHV